MEENLQGKQSVSATRFNNFWDFRNVRVYQSTGEKVLDFLAGFIIIFFFVSSGLVSPIGMIILPLQIIAIFYLWKRRRLLAYGLLTAILLPFLVLMIVFAFGSNL